MFENHERLEQKLKLISAKKGLEFNLAKRKFYSEIIFYKYLLV